MIAKEVILYAGRLCRERLGDILRAQTRKGKKLRLARNNWSSINERPGWYFMRKINCHRRKEIPIRMVKSEKLCSFSTHITIYSEAVCYNMTSVSGVFLITWSIFFSVAISLPIFASGWIFLGIH